MVSKWFDLKSLATNLRLNGQSLRDISKQLKIPKSTLSGWFKDIKLSKEQSANLRKSQMKHLVQARLLAVAWHNKQKEFRIEEAKKQATLLLSEIDMSDIKIMELALAMLYLGEGFKQDKNGFGIGNSNPLILKFFISMCLNIYLLDINKIKCELHLRADQDVNKARVYWSNELGIPIKNFTKDSLDKRTIGSTTYTEYNGVCVVRCGNIALQRKLVYLAKEFCEEFIKLRAVSSVGRARH